MTETATQLKTTPLHALHMRRGARMVPFAGYEMPVQYPGGILAEHAQCRGKAALFDVSHMGQATLSGPAAASALEMLVPGDVAGLGAGRMRYTQFTNDRGGILDDLMVANRAGALVLVVNAARKDRDFEHLRAHLRHVPIETHDDRALLAIQGPAAAAVMARLAPATAKLAFMQCEQLVVAGISCLVSRSGYTGEDGFELSAPAAGAERLAELLLAEPEVAPAGLGARDSLRLEAGLCLYGHDIDEATSPVEAGLAWSIGRRRREQGGFPGATRILAELRSGTARRRVGLRLEGRIVAREGAAIADSDGKHIGRVTSGGFGPTIGGPIAMGYVPPRHAATGTKLDILVRGEPRPAAIVPLPFVPARYAKG